MSQEADDPRDGRVADGTDGLLLEARRLLRRGELRPAERLLTEAMPTNGVMGVEWLLLLAWIAASQKQHDKARNLLQQARAGPYPPAALQTWTDRVEQRLQGGPPRAEDTIRPPQALRDFLIGQQARSAGQVEQAIAAYRAASGSPAAQPFARYALACLGQDDFAALLANQPGLFLAVRCRVRLVRERFRRREASPAEFLDALQQAAATRYQDSAAEHFRFLATVLQQRQPDAAFVRELAASPNTDAAARNRFRAALELAVRRLPAIAARELLVEWVKRDDVEGELRSLVDRQLLRSRLLHGEAEKSTSVERSLPDVAIRLWDAARTIDGQSVPVEHWREDVGALRAQSRWRGLAQSLLLQEAAQRGDVAAVLALLDDVDAWRSLPAPPRFILRVLESVVVAQPGHSGWQRSFARWLQLWDLSALGPTGAILATHAGLMAVRGATAEPPSGIPAVPWFLHQASRALSREDAIEALAFTRRALALDPELISVPEARLVREALPEMERHAHAQGLAVAMQPAGASTTPTAGVLVDFVDALSAWPDGAAVLDALTRGDLPAVRIRLDALSEQPDLPPRLAHHLALLMQRAARAWEEREQMENAEADWRRSWLCWLRFLTRTDRLDGGPTAEDWLDAGPTADACRIVLDFLLDQHRHRINELLARNAIDAARRHWNLVRELPAWASRIEETLGRDLADRIERFREELATEYLLTTREVMRFGVIPEGWRADYEKGLSCLRRLLSLDRDNPRLLAALIEICDDWFLDLYHMGDPAALRGQVERFTPFALQLARRIADRPGDLLARAVLADFWKFRGFLAADREQKATLYREALRFNPANNNVHDLLAELQPPSD